MGRPEDIIAHFLPNIVFYVLCFIILKVFFDWLDSFAIRSRQSRQYDKKKEKKEEKLNELTEAIRKVIREEKEKPSMYGQ